MPLRSPAPARLKPAQQPNHDRVVQALRSTLGEEEFAAAFAAGRALSLEQVIDLAQA